MKEVLSERKLEETEALANLPIRYALSERRIGTFATTGPPFNYFHDLKYLLDGIVSKKNVL